jgi:transcriptional regulator GlxA family with amidase domain
MAHAPSPVWPETCEWISFWWRGGIELAGISGPEVRSDLNGRIVRQLAWLLDCQPVTDAARRRMVEALAYTVVHELGQLARSSAGDLAQRVRRFLREHLAEPLRLEDIAAGVSVSKYHLVRKFKRATGQTPMRALAEMRVAAARVLLTQTALGLDDVACHVGLADASHLSHTFRRVAGCTPGSLRRR